MTNMADCIARGMDFGEIDKARGLAAQDAYQQLLARYSASMNPARAAILAAKDLKEATAKAKTARYHKTVNQLQTMRRLHEQIMTAPDPAVALRNLIEWSEGSGFKGESVGSLTAAYQNSINADIYEVLQTVGLNVASKSRDGAMLTNLIRELHGQDTGNPLAKKLAGGVRGAQQRMRRLFNAYGGDIGELADYGVPHSHNADKLREAGFGAWSDFVAPRLAWDRITDVTTGKPFAATKGAAPDPRAAQRFLQDVYDGIVTAGWDSREASLTTAGKALYNQRGEKRLLHFGNADGWLEYNQKFGTSDPFSAMVGGLHGLARDVAMMRVLGPNPQASLEFATQVATKRAMTGSDAGLRKRVGQQAAKARAMLSVADGTANRTEWVAQARFCSGVRAVQASAQLGSAVLSSGTDYVTMYAGAKWIGMRPKNVISRSVELLASQATRETAARMGYVAETLADTGAAVARMDGKMFASGLPEQMSNFTMRATGLAAVTDFRRVAFKMELSGHLADNAHLPLAQVEAPLRRALEKRGITPADWDALRDPATQFVAPSGANFISPHHWLQVQKKMPQIEAEGLAMRLSAMMHEQTEFAVTTKSLEAQAIMKGGTKPGTLIGEVVNSVGMYKNYSITMMLDQYRRFLEVQGGWNKAMYAARLSVGLMLMGALTIQLKELSKGNDPRPMTDKRFWGAAILQGGGLGIFGDFLSSTESRIGKGPLGTVSGPQLGLGADLLQMTAGNAWAALKGEKTSFAKDAANLARRNTPFLSSAWYARLAYDRLVSDQLLTFIDPQADMAFKRKMKQQARDYGTQPWWLPGDTFFSRAPDLSNALGASK